jgi:hypothetical protein
MKFLHRFFRPDPRVVLIRREVPPMEEKALVDAFSVSDRHPLFRAVMQMTEEALEGARANGSSPQSARDHGQLAYYTGAAAHLEMLRDAFDRMQVMATAPREQEEKAERV